MDSQGELQNRKLHRTLCAVWLSTKEAILKDYVLGGGGRETMGQFICTEWRGPSIC